MTRFTLISIILILILNVSCNQSQNKKTTILTGQISELGNRNINLITGQNGYNAMVDSMGHFEFSFELSTPQYVNFKEINSTLFLIPGDHLTILKSDNGYKFTGGESALINTYYSDWEKYLQTVTDTADVNAYHIQEPLAFIKSVDSWIQFWKQLGAMGVSR